MSDISVVLLHGLGGNAWSLAPLALYLHAIGYTKTVVPTYKSDDFDNFNTLLNHVDESLQSQIDKDEEIIVIGQSMGGVVANNLHTKGWIVKGAIYIGSPLHGASLLKRLETILPSKVVNVLKKPAYEILKDKCRDPEPPHPYFTVSMGWFGTEFDGCVHKEEAVLDESRNHHLYWSDHRTAFADPRLFSQVGKCMQTFT